MGRLFVTLVLACLASQAHAQAIRNYTAEELFPGQICADDGTPWEGLNVGPCPQGYNGIRQWARIRNMTNYVWPPCDPCKSGQICYEFKPGVGKCTVPATNTTTPGQLTYLKEGEICLNFDLGGKWHPFNKDIFGKSCEWPFFSCNLKDPTNTNLNVYHCERIRDAAKKPFKMCYRAAGSRWWGGTDQVYYWKESSKQFKPCGGPNPDYPPCPSWCTAGDAPSNSTTGAAAVARPAAVASAPPPPAAAKQG